LNIFLYSVTRFSNKYINKYSNLNLDNTDDINNLNKFLDSNPIKINFKSHISSRTNGIILNIIFKFNIKHDMQLIYNYFYTLKKK
jgi:hypothetical protein